MKKGGTCAARQNASEYQSEVVHLEQIFLVRASGLSRAEQTLILLDLNHLNAYVADQELQLTFPAPLKAGHSKIVDCQDTIFIWNLSMRRPSLKGLLMDLNYSALTCRKFDLANKHLT